VSEPVETRHGVIAWMVRNPIAAQLLLVIVLVGGLFAASRVKLEVFPEFALDMVLVTVPYPGASPAEVEQGAVLAVEEAIRSVDGVRAVSSVASEGSGTVTAELLLHAHPDKALADIKSAVDRVTSFPKDVERPVVRLATRRREVVSIVLAGDQPLATLHELAERVRDRLVEHPDVTQVEVLGVPPVEISVEVPSERLRAYGLTLDDVARAIQAASLELPGGSVETRAGEVMVRMSDRREKGNDFADIVLRGTADGAAVRLGDVATIRDGYADTKQAMFLDGKRAVRVTAYRIGDETPLKVSDAVKAEVERLRGELPEDVRVQVWDDNSEALRSRLDLLLEDSLQGLLLVLVALALFMEARIAFWVAMGIPTSFLATFLLMPLLDVSVNMVTLFAFLIAVGIVVDDAIVVGEETWDLVEKGVPRVEAAIIAAKSMALPVTMAVLTTCVAFTPLMFIPGMIGKIFGLIPVIAIATFVTSLLDTFLIFPAHLAHGHEKDRAAERWLRWLRGHCNAALDRATRHGYEPALRFAARHRYAVVAAAIAIFALTLGAVRGGRVPFRFFPRIEGELVTASGRLPYGSPEERATELARALEAAARRAVDAHGGPDIVRGMVTRIGEGPRGMGSSMELGSHLVTVELQIVPSEQRGVTSEELAQAWSTEVPPLAGLAALTITGNSGPGRGAAITVQLSHPSTEVLEAASGDLEAAMRSFPQLRDVDNAWASGKPQLDLHLLDEARNLGLSSLDVARQVRGAFFGAEALREQRGRNEMRVKVRLPEAERRSEWFLEELQIRTPAGGLIPLPMVARIERGRSPTAITREEGHRTVQVRADLSRGVSSPQEVLATLQTEVIPELSNKYDGLRSEFVGQQRDQLEAFGSLGRGYLLALLVMYALMAIPFRSWVQPLIVLSAIPFGIVGAVTGHLLLGYPMSIMSVMGIVALSGIVVNDSIVFVDAANKALADGEDPRQAIVLAGARRLRPILLVSSTTFFGLAPLIFATAPQAKFLVPMAISLGCGVLVATQINLLLVPAVYLVADDVGKAIRRVLGREDAPSGPAGGPGEAAGGAPAGEAPATPA
jgi:multidrug efflux pump subunit AcrB